MKILTCTGYGGTGSSVISDLMKEFYSVKSLGDFEFTFISEPDGLRSLEYGLFDLSNRNNSDAFLKKFKILSTNLSKSRSHSYEKFFQNNYLNITNNFLSELIDIEWSGYSLIDVRNENNFIKFFYYIERFIQKKILGMNESSAKIYTSLLNKKMYYSAPTRERFYQLSKKYTQNLFLNIECKDYHDSILFDQLVPAENVEQYFDYFDNLKVVIVDRDPRDLYFLQKYKYKECFLPWNNVQDFILFYKSIRERKPKININPNILYVNFEDFVFNYEDSVKRLVNFFDIDFDNWYKKGLFFNPLLSINNTNIYKNFKLPNELDDIKYIENSLENYLYNESAY
jgi:hypothetical protein